MLFNNYAYADIIFKEPSRDTLQSGLVKSLNSLEVTAKFMNDNSKIVDVNASALNIWQYHSVINNAYQISLSMTESDVDSEEYISLVNNIIKAKELINGRAKTSITNIEQVENKNFKEALTFFVDDSAVEFAKNKLKTLNELRFYLYSDLVTTIPNAYSTLLACVSYNNEDNKNLWDNSTSREGLLIIEGALKELKDFDSNINKDPNKIEYTNASGEIITGTIGTEASNILNKYDEKFKALNKTESTVIEEEFARAGTSVANFDYLHERTAFVTRVPDEKILEALGKEEFNMESLTGPDIWDIITGGEAKSGSSSDLGSIYTEGPGLRSSYLAMFASTAVYVPMHSKIGDVDYMEALYSLVGQENKEEIKEMHIMLSQYKKPLYFYTDKTTVTQATKLGKSYQEYDGLSQRLSLNDLLEATQSKQSLVAVTIKGKMITDKNAWTYYNNELSQIGDSPTVISSQIEDSPEINGNGASYSRAVLEINNSLGDPDPGTVTSALITNIFEDEYIKGYWTERGEESVYLDAIGNIILGDGTLILPASANPTYFAVPCSKSEISSWWYNPFTAAFFNTYPEIYGSEYSPSIQTKKDSKKMIFSFEDPTQVNDFKALENDWNTIKNPYELINTTGFTSIDSLLDEFKTVIYSLSSSQGNRFESLGLNAFFYPLFTYSNTGDLTDVVTQVKVQVMNGDVSTGDKDKAFKSALNLYPIRMLSVFDGNEQILPYISPAMRAEDNITDTKKVNNYIAAKRLASNMYMYITDNTQTISEVSEDETPTGNGLLREGYMFANIVCSVLDGMVTPVAYEKSISNQNILLSDATNQIEKIFLSLSKYIINLTDNINGFMGIGSPDDTSFIAPIYRFILEYKYYIFFVIALLILLLFIRTKSYSKALINLVLMILVVYGFMFMLPKTIPFLYGSITEFMSSEIASNVLLVKGEQYDKIFSKDSELSDLGSIKLYDLSLQESYQLRLDRNINPNSFMTDKIPLEYTMGVFLQGNEIKLDLKTYFTLNTYYSEFDDSEGVEAYQIKSGNHMPAPELLTYYNPMLELEKGFVENLNLMLKNYHLPKSIIKYPDGLYKDASVINSYIHSYPFLYILPKVQKELNDSSNINEMRIIQEDFPYAGDVLRLQWLVDMSLEELTKEKPDIVNSIWIQTMSKNGYYDPNLGTARRQTLVDKVNRDTYSFLIKVTPDIGLVSDENMIRLTSLYATMSLNAEISRFNNIVYPRFIAIEEMNVKDIVTGVVLKNSQRFLFYDVDLVSNIYVEKGFLGLISLNILVLMMSIISLCNTILIPFVYIGGLLFGMCLLIYGRSIKGVLTLTFRLIILLLIVQLLGISTLNLYGILPYGCNIYILTTVIGLIMWYEIKVIKYIFKNTTIFGSNRDTSILSKIRKQSIRFDNVQYSRINNSNQYRNNRNIYNNDPRIYDDRDEFGYEYDEEEQTIEGDHRRYNNY